jgi:hypothetical protein
MLPADINLRAMAVTCSNVPQPLAVGIVAGFVG